MSGWLFDIANKLAATHRINAPCPAEKLGIIRGKCVLMGHRTDQSSTQSWIWLSNAFGVAACPRPRDEEVMHHLTHYCSRRREHWEHWKGLAACYGRS